MFRKIGFRYLLVFCLLFEEFSLKFKVFDTHPHTPTHKYSLVFLIINILDFDSYSGVPNGDTNHENSGDGAPRGENRGGRPRRYQNRAPRRSRNSEDGKPAQGEKVNNFDN